MKVGLVLVCVALIIWSATLLSIYGLIQNRIDFIPIIIAHCSSVILGGLLLAIGFDDL